MSEEQRAADYRTQQVTRLRSRIARRVALQGSASARAALIARWLPVSVFPNAADVDLDVADDLLDGYRPFGPDTN